MQSFKIEEDLKKVVENLSKEDFIYDLLLVYGIAKATVTLAKKGKSTLTKKDNQVIIKQKVFFEANETDNLHALIDDLSKDEKTYAHKPRFIIVTDYKTLLAIDTKTKETLDIAVSNLYKRYDFFLPWSGREKYIAPEENAVDRKAAEKMAKIYDEIVKENPDLTKNHNHALNVFLTRLLFCFFAEDTYIFEDNQFTKAIAENTEKDGSDLSEFIEQFFKSLDIQDKSGLPTIFQQFPYVNGHLFSEKSLIPKLTANVRKLIIECGEQDWKEINPDIFGSMFQAVASIEVRSNLGQHYTSVPNIMKVINPLFMDNLREEFENADTENKLKWLLHRIYNLKIFDPACGSGNFLIISYKQLRFLEMDILAKIQDITGELRLSSSNVHLSQFYGIEIDDFACEIARLSLWLAEHQMNRIFKDKFGNCRPTLPLKESGKIVCGNATRLDWEKVCPKHSKKTMQNHVGQMTLPEIQQFEQLELQVAEEEIYILGNPPYLGAKLQNPQQKDDLIRLLPDNKNLDYISCWFYKGCKYIDNYAQACFAFVTTNSICQGEQVYNLWSNLANYNAEIHFAYQSFKWTNNAKNNAGVTCIIIGLKNKALKAPKKIYTQSEKREVKNINAYLLDASNIFVKREKKAIVQAFPPMTFGSMPRDGGFLTLTPREVQELLSKYPKSKKIIKRYIGSAEFIRGIDRYCLWIEDEDLPIAKSIPIIQERLNKICEFRSESDASSTRAYANYPHKFVQRAYKPTNSIIVPRVSSERREYIPCGFLDKNVVISDSAQAIYDAEPWIFGVITSHMHMVWVRAVAGRLKTDYRYSAELCYNTFPFQPISDKQKQTIEMYVNNILAEREKHSEKTMAELYDPDKMPEDLRRAHHDLDLAIESCYHTRPFASDEKRLEHLFKMYEIMTDPKKSKDDLQQLMLL